MQAYFRGRIPKKILVFKDFLDKLKPLFQRWGGEEKDLEISISGKVKLIAIDGDVLVLDAEPMDFMLEAHYRKRTLKQLGTLKAIEALLYWANNGHYPVSSDHLYGYHQVIMQAAGVTKRDPHSGNTVPVTTSSPLCTTSDMNRMIDAALAILLEYDIPLSMKEPASGKNIVELYQAWYTERSVDPETIDSIKSWAAYLETFPYDEFFVVKRQEAGTGQTQKIHIVSRGSDKADIEEPWNWIHGATSIHERIHKMGWESILHEFPHIIPKVRRARELARKKELI